MERGGVVDDLYGNNCNLMIRVSSGPILSLWAHTGHGINDLGSNNNIPRLFEFDYILSINDICVERTMITWNKSQLIFAMAYLFFIAFKDFDFLPFYFN